MDNPATSNLKGISKHLENSEFNQKYKKDEFYQQKLFIKLEEMDN